MLTQERADLLTKYLEEDQDRAKNVLSLEVEAAAKEINRSGYDFSVDELTEYGNALKLATAQGELNEDDLENVSGGVVVTVSVGIMAACIAGGFVAGFVTSKNIW